MESRNRRDFLADVGRGMLLASLGPALTQDLGIASASAAEGAPDALTFGKLEPLVAFMQDTPVDKLLPGLTAKMADGVDLKTLVAAGALANARSFGGQDYTGYHTLMALTPAYEMSREMPEAQRALPVFKVLYRNTGRIQQQGGRKAEVLHDVHEAEHSGATFAPEALQALTRKADMAAAERTFAAMTRANLNEAYQHLQFSVQDEIDVHRVVLSWRSWAMLDLTGKDHATTLLRQSVRYCVNTEKDRIARKRPESPVRTVLPKLLDQYKLLSKPLGTKTADDTWVSELCETIYGGTRDRAAEAVAAALAEGFAPASVAEAIVLASNLLVLRDPGRQNPEDGKPKGSVHGASVGVHASDSANAWRNIARVSNQRNAAASLIVGAYHTAGQSGGQHKQSYPFAEHLEPISTKDAAMLLRDAEAAIQAKEQAKACALVYRYGELGHAPRAAFDLLLKYAVSEDGALHAEKYYRTVSEEYANTRPAFRNRHLAALARVTASEVGFPAPGYSEACKLMKG